MDLQIFQAINNLAGRWHWLDWIGKFFAGAFFGDVTQALIVFGIGAIIWYFRKDSRRMIAVALVSAAVARGIFVEIIRHLYHRVRPVPVEAFHRLAVNTEWSFPSGHASFFFALATGIFLYNKKLGWVFYVIAALMGVARIFVGVHWPTDILVGAALGMLTALGVDLALKNRFSSWLDQK